MRMPRERPPSQPGDTAIMGSKRQMANLPDLFAWLTTGKDLGKYHGMRR
jgi:hypothetical protein